MSGQLTPAKRQNDRNESNIRGKWQKTSAFNSQNLRIPPGTSFFRVLCPASKGGSVIGKGGGIISQIRQETGAKVRVEETVPGCDERIIVIIESDKENGVDAEQNKGEEEKNDTDKVDNLDEQEKEEKEGEDKESVDTIDKESGAAKDSQCEKGPSAAQKALLLVFERIAEGEPETVGENEENDKASAFSLRLLVLSSQAGGISGNEGSVIKQMESESGAQIRILPSDELPICASPSDELVQISGSLDAIRKALLCVSQQILEHPPQDDELLSLNTSGPSSQSSGHPFSRQEPNYPFSSQGPPYVGSRDSESGILGRNNPSQDILTFRLLCPDEKAGGVIGKGGSIVKALQHESGCEIKVLDGVSGSEDRIIIISGPSHPDDRISAPQDAVLRVQTRIVRAAPESKEKTVIAKILIASNQIGCLLGKGGAVISEMRKFTGAYIRILGKDQLPKCASENEEVVQINGEFDQVQEALLQITNRLREHFFRDAFPSMNHPSNHAFPDQGPPFPSYMGRRELSPPGMYSGLGPSFHKFNAGMPPMHGGFHPHDDRSPFMHNIHRPGFPPHLSERLPPAAPWRPQGPNEGAGGPLGLPDYPGGPQRRMGGFGGGSHQAIITNTTVEVVVPRSAVPAIYGEDGGCLKQIREISDAKITINDPKPGASETAIIISGTPEQTHAAQSLIQAFVISESNNA
ncbi:hypothetical protein DCAR_0522128 [Daucus carota subsp. sativus]|uniref:Uncharacterized protein n=1 Tax=Daucus carota subsp. sativus TaxID=79200 RepID=A0A164ZLL4_DAUCS|nr:PREDICTED: KH domain-containing protein At4g18375-like [Daucus carota subsp. sativus]XP_017253148.1 PREDICTED: KH domain-containing protein At4g18375-like [Daucus carota subsp. sativus]WOH02739.1 hypothetical protein DCAR_0522128 [Daucus carota subsp. sativus]